MASIVTTSRLAALLLAIGLCWAGNAAAAPPCPDNGSKPQADCTKEIKIYNNTGGTIYAILQASIQTTDALNCTKAAKGGGDVWLQAALGDTTRCHKVGHDYYAYINPTTGIPDKGFAAVNVPWWSKRLATAPDLYIDWWRGARVVIFDDQTALNDSYSLLKNTGQVKTASGSPVVSCTTVANNKCLPAQLQIFQVSPKATIATKTPFQLNEFTFADVKKVIDNGTAGGEFIDFNQNYNVSNVDQVYLPIAIEPVRSTFDIGYLGTTSSVTDFRTALGKFTGADSNPTNPANWPIYNNPKINNKLTYPKAGIRVPSPLIAFNFYMNPSVFPPPISKPEIIPATPPKALADIMKQWTDCTTEKGNCPQSEFYEEENQVFLKSYATYIGNCSDVPKFLMPVPNSNPPMPSLFAFLRFVHGWVPFNVNCAEPELPTVDQLPNGSRAPIDYIHLQYNYLDTSLKPAQWFNPYTRLIHSPAAARGLGASAYAFSIDDQASFLSNSGGSLPGGLIIAVGGPKGLTNPNQFPPKVPEVHRFFDFSVTVGAASKLGAKWVKYGVCSTTADREFPPAEQDKNGFFPVDGIGVDPKFQTFPCTMTFADTNGKTYQIKILKAGVPPAQPIWPPFKPSTGKNFDPRVVSCPSGAGIVPPKEWCDFATETANPDVKPPFYAISPRAPVP